MKYKIIPCRNMNDVPDVALARIVSFLDPISQCNVAPVSSVLRQVVAGQTDSKGVPITPEQRRMAAVRYLDVFAQRLFDKTNEAKFEERSSGVSPGEVYEEAMAMMPSNIKLVLDKRFLKAFSWSPDLLLAVGKYLLHIPGQMDRMITFSNAMPLRSRERSSLLAETAMRLVRIQGREDEALEMANGISDGLRSETIDKSYALGDIARHMLTLPGQEERAIEIVNSISDKIYKNSALADIARDMLALSGQEERAIEIANSISDNYSKNSALADIASHMVTLSGKEERAIEIAKSILKEGESRWDSEDLSRALSRIVETLITLPDYEAPALDLIKEISDEDSLAKLVRAIVKLPGREDLALEMANGISLAYYRGWALCYIACHVVTLAGQEDRALEIAREIEDGDAQIHAMWDIVSRVTERTGNESRAFEIIKGLDTDIQEPVLGRMACHIATLPGQEARALEIVNGFLSEENKNQAVSSIRRILYDKVKAALNESEEARALEIATCIPIGGGEECYEIIGRRIIPYDTVQTALNESEEARELETATFTPNRAMYGHEPTAADAFRNIRDALFCKSISLLKTPGEEVRAVSFATMIPYAQYVKHLGKVSFEDIVSALLSIPGREMGVLDIALSISDEQYRSRFLLDVVKQIPEDRVFDFAMAMPDEGKPIPEDCPEDCPEDYVVDWSGVEVEVGREAALSIALTRILKLPDGESLALESVNSILDLHLRSVSLGYIAQKMCSPGQADRAIEIAMMIPEEEMRAKTFSSMAQRISFYGGQEERAIEIAMMIPEEKVRSETLHDLIIRFSHRPIPEERALEIVSHILDEGERDQALAAISGSIARRSDGIERSLEVADMISDTDQREFAIMNIAIEVAGQPDQEDRALEIANLIKDERMKDNALSGIAIRLVNRRPWYLPAIGIVDRISSVSIKDGTFQEMIEIFEYGDPSEIEFALLIARKIQNDEQRISIIRSLNEALEESRSSSFYS